MPAFDLSSGTPPERDAPARQEDCARRDKVTHCALAKPFVTDPGRGREAAIQELARISLFERLKKEDNHGWLWYLNRNPVPSANT